MDNYTFVCLAFLFVCHRTKNGHQFPTTTITNTKSENIRVRCISRSNVSISWSCIRYAAKWRHRQICVCVFVWPDPSSGAFICIFIKYIRHRVISNLMNPFGALSCLMGHKGAIYRISKGMCIVRCACFCVCAGANQR